MVRRRFARQRTLASARPFIWTCLDQPIKRRHLAGACTKPSSRAACKGSGRCSLPGVTW